MKSKIQFFSALICLTMLVSMMNFTTAQASRESFAPTYSPSVYLPMGTTYTKTPTFYWRGHSDATYYRISVFRRSDNQHILYNLTLSAATYCKFGFCKFTPSTFINPMVYGTEYKWKIAAGNADGLGPYSPLYYFTPKSGINSTFTSNATGWQPKVGSWMVTTDGYYRGTSSVEDQFISTRYDGIFDDFTFEAKVMKPGNQSTTGYGIIIRGDTSAYTAYKMWNSGYSFTISDDADFIIVRHDPGGASETITGWNGCNLVDEDGYNTLKVSANGGVFSFYINGTFVAQFSDATYGSGRVGLISFYDGFSFYADYAKLTMPLPYYSYKTETVGRPTNKPILP